MKRIDNEQFDLTLMQYTSTDILY